MKSYVMSFFLVSLVALLAACDTGNNDAPVINANELTSASADSSVYSSDQGGDQGNVEVVPSSDIEVVSQSAAEQPIETQSVEQDNQPVHPRKVKHHEHAHYIHHVAVGNDKGDAATLQYHNALYQARTKSSGKIQQSGWSWPARGEVISTFSTDHPGIEIQGVIGESVTAVEAGTVIYSQNNVSQYGNMIIIEHGNHLMTAYAYNKALLVQPGDTVVAGQSIATMGKNPENKTCLYFEVRRNGKPVNPMVYLSKQP